MEANKLRIGNIVMSKINGVSIVEQLGSSINPNYVGGRSVDGKYWQSGYLPVEISEQWLIDLGFKKEPLSDGSGYYYTIEMNDDNHCDLSISSGDKNGFIEVALFPYEDWFRFRYVHELQNLYYVITGRELELKKSDSQASR